MSEQETIRGTIRVSHANQLGLEEGCKAICEEAGKKKNERWHATWLEVLKDELYDSHIVLDGVIYDMKLERFRDSDIFEMKPSDVNTYSFLCQYYNGGCGQSEAIEEAFSNMKGANDADS